MPDSTIERAHCRCRVCDVDRSLVASTTSIAAAAAAARIVDAATLAVGTVGCYGNGASVIAVFAVVAWSTYFGLIAVN